MAKIINLKTITDDRGSLNVIEKILPFDIKRVYYMYDVQGERGDHRHKKAIQALIAIHGSCRVVIKNTDKEEVFLLDNPDKCLIVYPEDWHTMDSFTPDGVLLVLSSEYYDKDDYIREH